MKILRKLFTKKEDYKNGSETEHQIRTRKKGAKLIVGGGSALTGAVGGGAIAYDKASSKALDITTKAYKRHLARLIAVEEAMNRVKPQDIGEYTKLLKAVENKLNNSLASVQKLDRSSKKIVENATKKGAVKGALVGTAVGGGLAYLANKEAKKTNIRINKARRNKNESSVKE